MTYVLDTCVLSETTKKHPDEGLVAWLRVQKTEQLFITTFTLGELRKGIERLAEGTKKHQLMLWLAKLTDTYQQRFLDFDPESAMIWGTLCADCETSGHPLPVIDALIASCALRFGCTLVTRNEKDYRFTGVPVLNPWSGSPN